MKTRNNVQEAILKSAAVIVSLVLISFTVNAQNFWKSLLQNETFSQIAMAMVDHEAGNNAGSENASNYTDANFAEYAAIETEESLKLEDWMLNDANFATTSSFAEETETPMELENWMINENLFTVPTMDLNVETEAKLELESWMINDDVFNVELKTKINKVISGTNFVYTQADEPDLNIEKWMVTNKNWRK